MILHWLHNYLRHRRFTKIIQQIPLPHYYSLYTKKIQLYKHENTKIKDIKTIDFLWDVTKCSKDTHIRLTDLRDLAILLLGYSADEADILILWANTVKLFKLRKY